MSHYYEQRDADYEERRKMEALRYKTAYDDLIEFLKWRSGKGYSPAYVGTDQMFNAILDHYKARLYEYRSYL